MPTAKPHRSTISAIIIALTACGDPSQTLPPPPSSPTATADPTGNTSAAPSPDTIPIVSLEDARGGAEVIIPDPCPEADEISLYFMAREDPGNVQPPGQAVEVFKGPGSLAKADLERISVRLPAWYESGWIVTFRISCSLRGTMVYFDDSKVVLK